MKLVIAIIIGLAALYGTVANAQTAEGANYLVLQVEPSYALVFIDGQPQTVTDGISTIFLACGSHKYKVLAPGHRMQEGHVDVQKGQPAVKKVSLAPEQPNMQITTATSGTAIYVDGDFKGTDSWRGTVEAGTYLVEGRKQGYKTFSESLKLDADEALSMVIPALQPECGTVKVAYQPSGARVLIDGVFKGTTPVEIGDLPAGAHKVEILCEGYLTHSCQVDLVQGRTNTLRGSLEQIKPKIEAQAPKTETPAEQKTKSQSAQETGEKKANAQKTDRTSEKKLAQDETVKIEKSPKNANSKTGNATAKSTAKVQTTESAAKTQAAAPSGKEQKTETAAKSPQKEPVTAQATDSAEQETSTTEIPRKNDAKPGFVGTRTVIGGGATSASRRNVIPVSANGVAFNMVLVDGGEFEMGATAEQGTDGEQNEDPAHTVTVDSYYIAETEVTQDLWAAVMGYNPSAFKGGDLPVEEVSWDECQNFLARLSQLTGMTFRLPTEAEWEYAARGGKKSREFRYSGGNDANAAGWYIDNSSLKTHPVKTKTANELGLYDMSGNVQEWCADWYGDYSPESAVNPQGADRGDMRVCRGGHKSAGARSCRVSARDYAAPGSKSYNIGLRVAM